VINTSGHSTRSFYTGLLSVRHSLSFVLLTLDDINTIGASNWGFEERVTDVIHSQKPAALLPLV